MNREIKFRGKCSHCDAWAYGNLVDYGEGEAPEIHGFDPYREGDDVWREITVDADTVSQFTGMTDKHGVKVFEGDIVDVYDFTSVYASKYRGVVKMYRGSWCVEYEDSILDMVAHPRLFFDDFADRKTDVVGNIHDNSELLDTK